MTTPEPSEKPDAGAEETSLPPGGLSEDEWEELLDLIDEGKCTPIIGAGASSPTIPLADELAGEWSKKYKYPLTDTWNLAGVAQYLAFKRYTAFPKMAIQQEIKNRGAPDFNAANSPHGMLADLELPIYVTTNYDDFMAQAIRTRGNAPEVDYFRWHNYDRTVGNWPDRAEPWEPTDKQPLVYHLHGHKDHLEYLVLTEEDYLNFLLRISEPTDPRGQETPQTSLLPPPVVKALASNALLFVGYSVKDWTFRILFRGIAEAIKRRMEMPNISIQLPPKDVAPGKRDEAREHLRRLLSMSQGLRTEDVGVYWGKAEEFTAELIMRREKRRSDGR
jgi:hypothetical protein